MLWQMKTDITWNDWRKLSLVQFFFKYENLTSYLAIDTSRSVGVWMGCVCVCVRSWWGGGGGGVGWGGGGGTGASKQIGNKNVKKCQKTKHVHVYTFPYSATGIGRWQHVILYT